MTKLSKIDPARTIIFLDIDGTILDVDQRPNAPGLPGIISRMSRRGFRFGLNSNRALEDVLPIVRRFHLTGPFVLENGAYVLPALRDKRMLNKQVPADAAERIRKCIQKVIANRFPGVRLVYTDTVRLIKKNEWGRGIRLYANDRRRFSASIHHRISGRQNFAFAQKLARKLNSFFASEAHIFQATANRHGSTVTVGIRRVNKKSGLQQLKKLYPQYHLIAIGDGEGDIDLRAGVDELYAVRNAVPELKQISDGVATKPVTAGVVEILQGLAKRSRTVV